MTILEQIEANDAEITAKFPGGSVAIPYVSQGMFSIARYYGGIKFNGKQYTYIPDEDLLVRDDVAKWLTKRDKQAREIMKQANQACAAMAQHAVQQMMELRASTEGE